MSVPPAQCRPAWSPSEEGGGLPAPALSIPVVGGTPAPGPCGHCWAACPGDPGARGWWPLRGVAHPWRKWLPVLPCRVASEIPSRQVSERPGCRSGTRGLGCEGLASRGQRGSPRPSWGWSCGVGVRPGSLEPGCRRLARGQVAAGKGMWPPGCAAPHLVGPARVTAPHPSPRPVHHFNLGRRIPGFDYGPDGFGTGLTPLHLSDDGEGGTFHFHDPPPPYTAYKYPDMDQPDDPPPPYEASINPDSVSYDPAGDPWGVGARSIGPILPVKAAPLPGWAGSPCSCLPPWTPQLGPVGRGSRAGCTCGELTPHPAAGPPVRGRRADE